jgi:hypothetical protein
VRAGSQEEIPEERNEKTMHPNKNYFVDETPNK